MIQIVGDIAPTGLYVEQSQNNSKRIENILPYFENDFLKIANLETPVFVEKSENPLKNKIHTTNYKALCDILIPLNVNIVSLANNHIFDCTLPGLKATIKILDDLGIKFSGAGYEKKHLEPVLIKHYGKTIAFLAYVDLSTNPKTETFDDLYINYFDLELVKADISKIIHVADEIICSIHWGTDYSHYPTPLQRQQALAIIDFGATIIMGHHSHTIQPFEKYKDGFVFYSLGSLTFGDYKKKDDKYGGLYKKTKIGLIVTIDEFRQLQFQTTFEKIGNYLVGYNLNYLKWNSKKWKLYNLSRKYRLIMTIRNIKEKIIDRIHEYFFGYYHNPIGRFLQFKNILKIKKILK